MGYFTNIQEILDITTLLAQTPLIAAPANTAIPQIPTCLRRPRRTADDDKLSTEIVSYLKHDATGIVNVEELYHFGLDHLAEFIRDLIA